MLIKRDRYLNKLINKMNNGLVKIVAGLRRSGKTFLLFNIFKKYLEDINIASNQIITFAFDNKEDLIKLDNYNEMDPTLFFDNKKNNYKVNSDKFLKYILDKTSDEKKYYILIDEIQLLDNFYITLNTLLKHNNFDIFVTGSNSKMLSKDIITDFRGRGDVIEIHPLSFKEYLSTTTLDFYSAYREYSYFGGMPYLVNIKNDLEKQAYLKNLVYEIYIKDITERNNIIQKSAFITLLEILASNIGSYNNPTNIENTFKSKLKINYNHLTINNHIEHIIDAFIISKVKKYDIKGKKYIGANNKYYYTDIGLRNALLNFRQQEPTHIMENIIYNELINLGYSINVGIVEIREKNNNIYQRKQLETDFICNKINERIYIQVAYTINELEKYIQEQKSLVNINDNFRKIIITNDNIKNHITKEGIEIMSLQDFLLNFN